MSSNAGSGGTGSFPGARPARRPLQEIVGRDSGLREAFAIAERVLALPISVAITGESGTGKELIARHLHFAGSRRAGPWVAHNCAATPATLLESELFGYRRGAFSGATEDRPGLFEAADGGTLFLDEISETSGEMQAKLLRALQEREVRRLGESFPRPFDARIITTSNRDLEDDVRAGRFRADLLYRLAVVRIRVPPLRARRYDIPLLVDHFLARFNREFASHIPGIAPEALRCLLAYDFPGNVRELENEIARAVALAEPGMPIALAALSESMRAAATARPSALKSAVRQFERTQISHALRTHDGNRTRAASALGLTRRGLLKKMRSLGLRAAVSAAGARAGEEGTPPPRDRSHM